MSFQRRPPLDTDFGASCITFVHHSGPITGHPVAADLLHILLKHLRCSSSVQPRRESWCCKFATLA